MFLRSNDTVLRCTEHRVSQIAGECGAVDVLSSVLADQQAPLPLKGADASTPLSFLRVY